MEEQIRRIVREEIARALGAVGAVADNAMGTDPYEDSEVTDAALMAISRTVERVARDVLADTHPVLDTEHASTEPVHTITTVPERARASCTCHRHTHVMGHDDRCGAPFCYCLSPVRARAEHTASTEAPRTCTVCEHGEHDQGKCTMHVYLRGVASPCPCLASRTLGAQPSTPSNPMCTACSHTVHGAWGCGHIPAPFAAPCKCTGVVA